MPECPCTEITLLDINPTTLETSRRRILPSTTAAVTTILADATLPLPIADDEKFNSISMFYLLHCLPGSAESKNKVFDVVRPHLAQEGVLIGATILPLTERMNWLARWVMGFYNRKGIFSNEGDCEKVFTEGLTRNFESVHVWVIGVVMCWTARRPKVY